MDLNVRTLTLFKGERCKKALNGGSYPWLKMGFLETLGQHKTLFLPLSEISSQSPGRAVLQLYCPCKSVCILIILCPYMHYLIIVI